VAPAAGQRLLREKDPTTGVLMGCLPQYPQGLFFILLCPEKSPIQFHFNKPHTYHLFSIPYIQLRYSDKTVQYLTELTCYVIKNN
jgi:hypothetical protein